MFPMRGVSVESGIFPTYAFAETEHGYDTIIEDWPVNVDNPYIRRRIKTAVLSLWQGKMASEAPLLLEYLTLIKNKYDAADLWKRDMLQRRHLTTGVELQTDMVEAFGSGIREELIIFLERSRDLRGDEIVTPEYSAKIAVFHKLPKVGEMVFARKDGYIIRTIFFDSETEKVTINAGRDGNLYNFLLEELYLNDVTGMWMRDSIGILENTQDVLRWLALPVRFVGGTVSMYFTKYRIAQVAGKHTRGWLNSAMYNGLFQLPWMVDTVYEGMVRQLAYFPSVAAVNATLPLEQQTYVDAITNEPTSVEDKRTMMEKAKEMADNLKKGVQRGIKVVANTVEKVFYATAVLGTIGLLYKIAD